MKKIAKILQLTFTVVLFSAYCSAQEKEAKEVVGITGESIYHKFIVEIVGTKKDTIRVFDSASLVLPLLSDNYFLRVHRVNYKGERKEYRVKSYNLVINFNNDSSQTQQFYNKWIDDPFLGFFRQAKSGNILSIGEILIYDESDKIRNVGSYQLLYR